LEKLPEVAAVTKVRRLTRSTIRYFSAIILFHFKTFTLE